MKKFYIKQLSIIFLIIIVLAGLISCSSKNKTDKSGSKIFSEYKNEKEEGTSRTFIESANNSRGSDDTLSENNWHEITGTAIEESLYIENLDIAILEKIAGEIQGLVLEIQKKEMEDPEYVLEGRWNQDFRSSSQYAEVLNLGLDAVKPAYYIIYKSGSSGLYEYILASAIDDVTGYDYFVTENYQWSYSKEFLKIYNDKVRDVLSTFKDIIENQNLSEAEKEEKICKLGIFAVAPLLNETDSPSPRLSGNYLEKCLRGIIGNFEKKDMTDDNENWRDENEQTFRNIIEILEINTKNF